VGVRIDPADEIVTSERLALVWMSPEFMLASLKGRVREASEMIDALLPPDWPNTPASGLLKHRLSQTRSDPGAAPWLLRAMLRRDDRAMVGYFNFHGPPFQKKAELGYTVFERFRRQGYARECAMAMMNWARARHGITRFVVSISPDNQASLALAAQLSFVRVGTQIDEVDGEEWVFELDWFDRSGGIHG
jgi:ribosomal-protein-alanine N-acetyltransferase